MKGLRKLNAAESRLAALLLLLIVLALAYLVLLHWWLVAPLRSINAEMANLRDVHGRYATAIAERPRLQKQLSTIGKGQATSDAFLSADDAGSGAAVLMERVVEVVGNNQQDGTCDVQQKTPVSNLPDQPGEPYHRVGVSISLSCDTKPLTAVLHTLETGQPYLFVDDISIYHMPTVARDSVASALQVQFTVYGYLRNGEPANAASAATPGAAP